MRPLVFLGIWLSLFSATLWAQDLACLHGGLRFELPADNARISSLPANILPSDYVIVQHIEFEGNQSTRQHILQRELLFAPGDTLRKDRLLEIIEQSRENLLNTSLFNFVNASLIFQELNPFVDIHFSFVERWYIWPFPIFEIAERNVNTWMENPNLSRSNYGAYIVKENFRGRMERLSILARAGYRQNYGIAYHVPYINQGHKLGMAFALGWNFRRETNYLTQNNTQLHFAHPSGFALQQFYAQARVFYRDGIHRTHSFILGYDQFRFADSLLILNPNFSPGSKTFAPFFSLGYEYKNDHRDVRAYPLRGYYFDLRLRRNGLGILEQEKTDVSFAETSIRRFWALQGRWYFAAGINAKVSAGNFQPYFLQQGLGFRGDMVRGYENYVIDGQHFAVLKTNLKYELVPSRVRRLGFISNEKFSLIHYALYLNIFSDLGYVKDDMFFRGNPFSNTVLWGNGIGLDLVTYYDKVLRTEFSITRQGQKGIFFHLIAPI